MCTRYQVRNFASQKFRLTPERTEAGKTTGRSLLNGCFKMLKQSNSKNFRKNFCRPWKFRRSRLQLRKPMWEMGLGTPQEQLLQTNLENKYWEQNGELAVEYILKS